MTSSEIRQSFLDFFKSKQHTIVPSSSLLPDAPNLLFTNAGMNQFVPIFLGQTKCPYTPGRAADTQKCIRAGGKHNDLDDVGLDTYHHTFFEMLGNWSFGDYFKKEAIEWAWELVVERWNFPPQRLYATVYNPDKSNNEPSEFDQEAWDHWAENFRSVGLDPKVHIVNGNKKDNFWMMGDTGPCGPCSELHVDLTPNGESRGILVNKGDARCIEIWNLVFIQFNANPDGTFIPLPARHVDTGMGFERVTSIIQGTKDFKDFANAKISSYETDIFLPIFDALEKLSGKKYGSTLPGGAHAPSRVAIGAPPIASGEHTRPRVLPLTPSSTAREVSGITDAQYSRRNLPHFERPWAKYMVTFSTRERRTLTPPERDLVLDSVLHPHHQRQYQLYAACVMPDHVHLLFEPQIKEQDKEGKPVFWSLSEILQGIKSASAHNINKATGQKGHVWEKESVDRMIRGQSDMEEKFHYICRNPWEAGVVPTTEDYPWLWTPEMDAQKQNERARDGERSVPTARAQSAAREGACAPHSAEQIALDIAFRVVADHIRTLGFAIADGIEPGNTDRNYVLRRIHRRMVRYARTSNIAGEVFLKAQDELVETLARTMGDVFPAIRERKEHIKSVLRREADAFNKTLDKGIEMFGRSTSCLGSSHAFIFGPIGRPGDRPPTPATEMDFEAMLRQYPFFDTIATHVLRRALGLDDERVRNMKEDKMIPRLLVSVRDIPENKEQKERLVAALNEIPGKDAFDLYDTYGFPLDLTELMARERGLTVDKDGFEKLMEEQRARARAAQKKEIISLSQIETTTPTKFVGYENLAVQAKVLEVVSLKGSVGVQASACPPGSLKAGLQLAVILDTSVCYAEMGGQVGDTGELSHGGQLWRVVNTQKSGNTWLHFIEEGSTRASRVADRTLAVAPGEHTRPRVSQSAPSPTAFAGAEDAVGGAPTAAREGACAPQTETVALPIPGDVVTLSVDRPRREAIQRHHTVTHLFHWALHEVVSKDATQKGSFVGPDKLTFDFNSAPLTPQQIADIEKLVNERILENAGVSWTEVPYPDVKSRKDVLQFFGDKYGDTVRVVQVGGRAGELNGYSMELCGGTHTRATGEIGLFRIVGESAIAAGVRRIEAVAGLEAYRKATDELHLIKTLAGKVNSPVGELEKKIEALLAHQKELEKQVKTAMQRNASNAASELLGRAQTVNGIPLITDNLGDADGDFLQAIADALKGRFKGVVVLGGCSNNAVTLVATVSPEFAAKVQAGKIIQAIAPIVGGKGGGRPDNARGGGKDAGKLDEALANAKSLLGS